jgi:hypothetical protein
MTKIVSAIAAAVACLLLLATAPAQAQATRTWVSGVGNDVNPCSQTAPCKTFAGAISKTARGGEICVLDPGGFGAVTITKSVSIIAESIEAGVLVASMNAIIINITDPTDAGVVNLQGLDIEGLGASGSPGINGINILAAKLVTINKSSIRGFRAASGGNGIAISPASGNTKVVISNTSLNFNTRGVRVQPSGGGTAEVLLDHVTITNVTRGIDAGANATVRLSNSVITGVNSAIVNTGSAKVISFGNNIIAGNVIAANDAPTSTVALK